MRIPFRHGETILPVAAQGNWMMACRWLLRLRTNVNRTDILGRTALHHAVHDGAADTPRLLIAHGADLDAKDWQGRTPLDLAESDDGEPLARLIRDEISLRHGQRVKAVHQALAGKGGDAG